MPRRALFVAVVLAAAGCGQPVVEADPAPEAPAPAPVVEEVIPPKNGAAPAPADDEPAPAPGTPAVSALTGKIYLPKDGGRWPWKLAAAAAKVDGKGAKVTLGGGRNFLVVSPESGRFVLAYHGDRRDDKNAQTVFTQFVLGDVNSGKVIGEWEVKEQLIPLDLSPDGKRFAARSMWPDAKLTVGTVGADGALTRKIVVAHDRLIAGGTNANDAELHVTWAGFVGNDRVASAADGGQVRVFHAHTLTRLGTLDGTPKVTPCVTPDRKQLLAHAAGAVLLLDPAECRVLGTKAFPLPSGGKHFAVSPDGATLACAKQDRVRFISLKTGQFWDQILPGLGEHSNFAAHFSWAGPFLVCCRSVYDTGVSFAVWHHAHAEAEAYSPRQTWAAVRTTPAFQKRGAKIEGVVRAFDILPPDLAGMAAAAKGRPNLYTVAPGSAVKVDVTKLPPAKQAMAKTELEQRLWEVGYRTDPTSATVASLTLDPAVTKNTAYANLTNVPYTHQLLRLQLRHGGKVLYEQAEAKEMPSFITIPGGMSLASKVAAEGYGQPNYDGIKTARIPPEFRGPGFPDHGLGSTQFQADGPRYTPSR